MKSSELLGELGACCPWRGGRGRDDDGGMGDHTTHPGEQGVAGGRGWVTTAGMVGGGTLPIHVTRGRPEGGGVGATMGGDDGGDGGGGGEEHTAHPEEEGLGHDEDAVGGPEEGEGDGEGDRRRVQVEAPVKERDPSFLA